MNDIDSTSADHEVAPEATPEARVETDAPVASPAPAVDAVPGPPARREPVGEAAAASPAPSAQSIIDEGEIAADYIEELLDICDFDGDIDIEVRAGRSYISIDSSGGEGSLRLLSKPDTVNALQELTRIAVQAKTGEFSRLILDIGGSRAPRCRPCRRTSASSSTTSSRPAASPRSPRAKAATATRSSPAPSRASTTPRPATRPPCSTRPDDLLTP
jgi:spoIIIJ-associated protein